MGKLPGRPRVAVGRALAWLLELRDLQTRSKYDYECGGARESGRAESGWVAHVA